jgi:hypothetical protein
MLLQKNSHLILLCVMAQQVPRPLHTREGRSSRGVVVASFRHARAGLASRTARDTGDPTARAGSPSYMLRWIYGVPTQTKRTLSVPGATASKAVPEV